MGIDATDLKALKATVSKPDFSISIQHVGDGQGAIVIRQTIRDVKGSFAASVTVAEIGVTSLITSYAPDLARPKEASYGITSPQWTPEWVTLVNSLRVNDHITLLWTGSNNSIAMEEAKLQRDELRVKVGRPRYQKDSQWMEYLMAVEVVPKSNWTMVR